VSRKQDKGGSSEKQVQSATLNLCETPTTLGDFSQSAFLKLGLNNYFVSHPQEDEVAAFAAYLSRKLHLPQNHKSVKAHIHKVLAGQTSMELDWWIVFGEFSGLLENYLRERRDKIGRAG